MLQTEILPLKLSDSAPNFKYIFLSQFTYKNIYIYIFKFDVRFLTKTVK